MQHTLVGTHKVPNVGNSRDEADGGPLEARRVFAELASLPEAPNRPKGPKIGEFDCIDFNHKVHNVRSACMSSYRCQKWLEQTTSCSEALLWITRWTMSHKRSRQSVTKVPSSAACAHLEQSPSGVRSSNRNGTACMWTSLADSESRGLHSGWGGCLIGTAAYASTSAGRARLSAASQGCPLHCPVRRHLSPFAVGCAARCASTYTIFTTATSKLHLTTDYAHGSSTPRPQPISLQLYFSSPRLATIRPPPPRCLY